MGNFRSPRARESQRSRLTTVAVGRWVDDVLVVHADSGMLYQAQ